VLGIAASRGKSHSSAFSGSPLSLYPLLINTDVFFLDFCRRLEEQIRREEEAAAAEEAAGKA
jgi:hypothetical protein